MQKFVIVKYHGIKLSPDENGKPRLLKKYDAGSDLCLELGQISHPISYEEAERLKRDFGDAFEILYEADVPETKEEAASIEITNHVDVGNNDEWAPKPTIQTLDNGIFVQFPTDNEIVIKRTKKSFDKTEEPIDSDMPEKQSKNALARMKKSELIKLYNKIYRLVKSEETKLEKTANKPDFIEAILKLQG